MAITEPISLFGTAVSSDVALRISMLEGLNEVEIARQREVVRSRKYHEGDQGAKLTERLREFLNDADGDQFRLNVCQNVVTAVSERLMIDGFDCTELDVLDWVQELWQAAKLDAMQEEVHESTLRDGESFVIVDWDVENGRPRFLPHGRYTSVEAGGDGQGCILYYEEDDPNQKPQVALKQWIERTQDDIFERRNLYYPDRIEKWVRTTGSWSLTETIDWTSSMGGVPLGISVVHFRNRNMRPEASEAMPLQRAVNKSLLDLLASSDLTAFRIFVSLGFIPTTDGNPLLPDRSNLLPIQPGQVVGTTLTKEAAAFDAVDPAELNPQMDLTHQLILWLATTTNTPVSRFISTKLIASDETLKEQEGPLLSRVRSRQISFGNSWVECLRLAARLHNTFSESGQFIDDTAVMEPIWAEAQSRSLQEKLDILLKKQQLGIPQEQLWREAGYSSKRVAQMLTTLSAAREEVNTEEEQDDVRRESEQ